MDNNRQLTGVGIKLEVRHVKLLEERGENVSKYFRDLINKEEFNETLLLEKNKLDLKKIAERTKMIDKLRKSRKKRLSNLKGDEINFLVDSKRKLDKNPNLVKHFIKSYKYLFDKKVNRNEFLELVIDTFKKYPNAEPFIVDLR